MEAKLEVGAHLPHRRAVLSNLNHELEAFPVGTPKHDPAPFGMRSAGALVPHAVKPLLHHWNEHVRGLKQALPVNVRLFFEPAVSALTAPQHYAFDLELCGQG